MKNHKIKAVIFFSLICTFLLLSTNFNYAIAQAGDPKFEISFSQSLSKKAQDGRLLLLLSKDSSAEPRFQIKHGPNTQLVFGINVDGWEPEKKVHIGSNAYGYPVENLKNIPNGKYYVQALLNIYETYHFNDGRVLKLPRAEQGEGQEWNKKPGNFYSKPVEIEINSDNKSHSIELNKKIPTINPPKDTKYVKHIKIRSELLSEFWGQDVYLGANVLLPAGFNEHPEAHYPLMVFQGHFSYGIGGITGGLRTSPPDTTTKPIYSERFHWPGYNITEQREAYEFYKKWTQDGVPLYDHDREWNNYEIRTQKGLYRHYKKYANNGKPHYIVITIRHPTPYFDDSYSVNSANTGPYGDAINNELIPHIEKKFRGIGKGWSRYLYGGSTGGWEALATQIKYPEKYGGVFAACPDPIDFRALETINIYKNDNAYYLDSQFKNTPRPGRRNFLGLVTSTIGEENHKDLALGTETRSGNYWDAYNTTFSPVGSDGYPARIWDKRTGDINHEVAKYWKKNYDLRYILKRDWKKKLGEKLKDKIHIYVGDMDDYYANNAVYLMEAFLENTNNPYYGGEIDYGNRAGHCWNGDQKLPNALSRLHYNTQYLPKILQLIENQAPKDADLSSWWY